MYGNKDFNTLINDFCIKDDKNIKDFIIELSNKIDLIVDKENYINNYITNYYNEEYLNIIINKYQKIIKGKINELKNIYEEFTTYIDDKLISKFDNYLSPLFNGESYDDYKLFTSKETIRITKIEENGIKTKELLKEKIKEIQELLRFKNIEEIKESIISSKKYINVIIEIINKLNNEVLKYKNAYQMYEFNDISHMAIEIVKNNLEIRLELKEYFQEIMIDEYQDTSSIQEEFINYISNNNVYMVGDIKQSIYRFRNANPYIFQKKYNQYSDNIDGIKIDLIKNFRSRNEVLTNINEIFNLVMDNEIGDAEYLNGHNMVYGNTDYDIEDTKQNNNMEIYNYEINDDDEFSKEEKEIFIISEDIINKINNEYKIFDKKTKKLRPLKYSDICIITDRNKHLQLYKKILEYNGIPSIIYMDEDLTNDTVILIIKNLVDLVYHIKENIYDDKFRYLYTSVARSFIFEYKDNKIYDILTNQKYYHDKIISKCKNIDISFPLPDIINNIIDEFKIYEKLTILPDIEKNIVRINNLIDIANNINTLRYDISEFINYIDNVIELKLPIKYSSNTSSGNAIKIMNIHKSKGLEFSICYYTGMHNKFTIKELNSKNLFSNKYGIILPYIKDNEMYDTILKDIYKNDYYIEEISEKIRLLYVALTRAKEKIIIVTSLSEDKDTYSHMVPYERRIKYRSFLDIISSISVIDKYVVKKEAKYTHDYDIISSKEINSTKNNKIINKQILNIEYKELNAKHYSKESNKLMNIEGIKKMEYGTNIHETLEYANFKDTNNIYVSNLLKQIDNNYIKIYREYEFNYQKDDNSYTGIIDLMVEYKQSIYIIDYKLKNITDEEYKKQLNGYKEYIEKISNKNIHTFLYSIIDNTLMEVIWKKIIL